MLKPYQPFLMPAPDGSLKPLLPAGDSGLVLLAGSDGTPANAEAVHYCITGTRPYIVLFQEPLQHISTENTGIITLCLFGRHYAREAAGPVLAFYQTPAHGAENPYRHKLVQKLQLQGWPSVKQWNLPSIPFREQLLARCPPPLVVDDLSIDEAFLHDHFFSAPEYIGAAIFFKATSLEASAQLEQDFFRLCGNEMERHPQYAAYLQTRLSLVALQNEYDVLAERLRNADTTIGIIKDKYKADYDTVVKWYGHEYDVLPLWYKRFGHIIKVLMGKRTLQSLFHDNVKRYND